MNPKTMKMYNRKLDGHYIYFYDEATGADIITPSGHRLETQIFERSFDARKQALKIMHKINELSKFYHLLTIDTSEPEIIANWADSL